jgi:conjugal transfer/type IV secretion protein DotA/TraY
VIVRIRLVLWAKAKEVSMQEEIHNTGNKFGVKAVAKYALLPGIFPNLRRVARHISQFMFMFTTIFGAAGLIDKNHPCLRPENIGHYRFTDIVGLAASNVIFDKKHLPQTIMFFVVMISILLTALIFLGFVAAILMNVQNAQAQFFGEPQPSGGINYSPSQDWALQFLSRIFGQTALFPATTGGNMWFTTLLTGMLKHYSLAMMVIAAFMILYLLITALTESARSGQPFGSRFDSIWAPVRLALAIGLLIPVTSAGYNGAQLITFQSAVWGSNLATNAWIAGLKTLNSDGKKFFAASMSDPGYKFVRDMFLVNLCLEGVKQLNSKDYGDGKTYYSATSFGGFYTYSFGTRDAPDFCGQVKVMKIPETSARPKSLPGQSWPEKTAAAYQEIALAFLPIQPGGLDSTFGHLFGQVETKTPQVMENYVEVIAKSLMTDGKKDFTEEAGKLTPSSNLDSKIYDWIVNKYWAPLGRSPGTSFFATKAYEDIITAYSTWMMDSLKQDAVHGWSTAGVFYLRMSNAMSTISNVVNNPPNVTLLPSNLSRAYATPDNPRANDTQMRDFCDSTWNQLKNWFWGDDTCKRYELSLKLNTLLNAGQNFFSSAVKKNPQSYATFETQEFDRAIQISEPGTQSNLSTNVVTGPIIGTLYQFARINSKDLNPLGSVVSWGSLMMTISMVAYAIGLVSMGGGIGELALTIGHTFIIPGFVLSFLVPMMPFLHFMFAVIEWMISILEAVIGMPLWALSLITLEGDGLGSTGMEGVKRLFEIVLRPTIIILSLLASIIIFTAAIGFFNSAMDMFSSAYSDANGKAGVFQSALSGFGMIFMYVFAVYSLANSCFKLISAIPDNFGRWAGLESGFGGQIKTGINDIEGAIAGGLLFKGMMDLGNQTNKGVKSVKDDKKAKKNQKKLDDRLKNIESRLP